jgi:MFS family permease
MTAFAPARPADIVRPAYREPTFLRYVAGQAVSVLGDQVWYVALSWMAVRLASPTVAGLILAVSSVPRLALLLLGGAIVDRYGPRRLMIGSDLLRAVISLGAAGASLGAAGAALAAPGVPQPFTVALLVTVALAFGLADAVFLPAAGAIAPRLLQPDQLASGAGTTTLAARAALTVGAPLGGVLVAVGGLPLACLVNAVTFVVSVATLASVRPRPAAEAPHSGPLVATLRAGLAYVLGHRLLRVLLLVSLLTNLGFVGPMNVGLALVSTARGWGAAGIGDMLAGFGIGAVIGALLMIRVRSGGRVIAAVCAAIQGSAVFTIAIAPRLWTAVLATALAGLTSGPLAIVITSLIQRFTDDRYRGRVASVNTLANLGVTPMAMAVMGAVAGQLGNVTAFAGSAGLELAAATICMVWLRVPPR